MYFLGILEEKGYFRTSQGRWRLLSSTGDETPQFLEVSPEEVGRWALVKGEPQEEILYQAEILEILPDLTGALLKALLEKGLLTEEEILRGLPSRTPSPEPPLCALVIGHKKDSPGAVNPETGLSEFVFNDHLSRLIEEEVSGVRVQRVYRRTYRELPEDINALDPDFVVSLHCNAFDGRASGTEVLYYHRSRKGEKMARILLEHLVAQLGLPSRGIKPCTSEDRGGYLLRYTKAPCVICEPFFIDNSGDLTRAQEDLPGLARAYARAIEEIGTLARRDFR